MAYNMHLTSLLVFTFYIAYRSARLSAWGTQLPCTAMIQFDGGLGEDETSKFVCVLVVRPSPRLQRYLLFKFGYSR